MPVTLAELARLFGGRVQGADDVAIDGVASLERAGAGEIAYINDRKFRRQLTTTRAAAVIMTPADAAEFTGNALITDAPQLCFARVATFLHAPRRAAGVHPSAVVDASATLGVDVVIGACAIVDADAVIDDGAVIGEGCYVGRGSRVGARTQLVGNVWVGARSVLGRDCVVHPGAVIGSDGFGYAKEGERWIKIPQLGRVVIGDDVEIGANTTIDRGALDDTIIESGVKLDNLIQIAHNVRVGEHTIMAACVGIAGSVTIGRRCAFGGQVGIAGHLEIGDDVQVLGTSLVAGSITEPGTYSSAIPAERAERWRRNAVRVRQLDDIAQRLRELEQVVKKLKEESP